MANATMSKDEILEAIGNMSVFELAELIEARSVERARHAIAGLLAHSGGIGLATLKGILKLWLFLPPRWQGSFSAGNGPAMRSALLNGRARAWQHGRFWVNDPDCLVARRSFALREQWAQVIDRYGASWRSGT